MARSITLNYRPLLIAAVWLVLGCARPSASPLFDSDPGFIESEIKTSQIKQVRRSRTTSINRQDLERVVQQGLGVFLGSISVEAVLESRRFTGWRIIKTSYPSLDIIPGDIIRVVNGSSLETPPLAQEAWSNLIELNTIIIGVEREGTLFTVTIFVKDPLNSDAA